MEIRKYLRYIRFISVVRSFRRGEITKREILIAVGVLIALRIVIYAVMSFNGAHPAGLFTYGL